MPNLADTVRLIRESKNWSQEKLAIISGLSRDYIKSIETGASKHPRTDKLMKIARALGISDEELFEAAGYSKGGHEIIQRTETPEELLERLKLAQPVSVPVYTTFPFHAGEPLEPVEYVYRARPNMPAGKNIEGYIVHGNCLAPTIQNGDIIIVDRDGIIDVGDIVACQAFNKLFIGKLEQKGKELWLVNGESELEFTNCQIGAVVIEVIKRLK